jgi:hypothetical protein
MSALGQKQTSAHVAVMSALPPKADITAMQTNVRYVPEADIRPYCAATGSTSGNNHTLSKNSFVGP